MGSCACVGLARGPRTGLVGGQGTKSRSGQPRPLSPASSAAAKCESRSAVAVRCGAPSFLVPGPFYPRHLFVLHQRLTSSPLRPPRCHLGSNSLCSTTCPAQRAQVWRACPCSPACEELSSVASCASCRAAQQPLWLGRPARRHRLVRDGLLRRQPRRCILAP